MPTVINGLPAHVLLIHFVVVLVPAAALMLAASAVWPAARAKLGFLTPAVALLALALVPVTTNAGEWLEHHLGFSNAAIRKHADLGDTLLPWMIGVFVLAVAVWIAGRRYELSWRPAPKERTESAESLGFRDSSLLTEQRTAKAVLPVWVTALVAVVSVAVAVGTLITIYRIGDSGAHAVWSGVGKK